MTASAKPANAAAATPMMAQYLDIKAAHEDALLFYRMGDFYELSLKMRNSRGCPDITLTQRGQHLGQDVPMCGVPVHAAENYLEQLIRQGHRVPFASRWKIPPRPKNVVQSVVRRDGCVWTPGTLSEEALWMRAPIIFAALALVGEDLALAWLDMSTGVFAVCHSDTETWVHFWRGSRPARYWCLLVLRLILVPILRYWKLKFCHRDVRLLF